MCDADALRGVEGGVAPQRGHVQHVAGALDHLDRLRECVGCLGGGAGLLLEEAARGRGAVEGLCWRVQQPVLWRGKKEASDVGTQKKYNVPVGGAYLLSIS